MFKILFSFDGRIGRQTFFVYSVFLSIFILAIIGLWASVSKYLNSLSIALSAAICCYIWTMLALQAKRWHDLNCSGWRVLLWYIPILNAAALLMLIVSRGTKGTNRFGDDPLQKRNPTDTIQNQPVLIEQEQPSDTSPVVHPTVETTQEDYKRVVAPSTPIDSEKVAPPRVDLAQNQQAGLWGMNEAEWSIILSLALLVVLFFAFLTCIMFGMMLRR